MSRGDAVATATIIDDDAARLTIVVTRDAEEQETDGLFTILADRPLAEPVEVRLEISGTAIPGGDYVAIDTTLTFPADAASVTIPVVVLSDDLIEGDETVIVRIVGTSALSARPAAPDSATLIIVDANATTVSIEAGDVPAAEPGTDGLFVIRLGRGEVAPPQGITVTYTINGSATPGEDYETLPGSVTIPAGQSSVLIPVVVLDDDIIESTETVIVTLLATDNLGATINPDNHTATVTIEDDDSTTVSVTVSDDRVSEHGGPVVEFTVTLDQGKIAPPEGITISYSVSGTATAGADYAALDGSVTIPGGQSSVVIPLVVLDDEIVELDETVIITLTGTDHPGATINPEADPVTVTIEDDDQTTVSIIASLPNAAEPNINGQFTVRLDNDKVAPPGGIVVNYATSGTATTGRDYTELSETVTIPAGASAATIPVAVLDDQIVELDETVIVTLSGTDHPGAPVNPEADAATVTIADNDQTTVSIVASLPNAGEPNINGQFTVRLDNDKIAPPGGIVVSYTTSGTATPGLDYTELSGTVTIPAGASAAMIPIAVLDDEIFELEETVIVTLTATDHPGATIHPSANTAPVIIEDDDQTTVSIIANLPNAAEPNVNGQFTVRLDNARVAPPGGIIVSYTISGTATAGLDYTALSGTVTIPAGASTATIPVAVLDDQVVELDETVIVTLTGTNHPGATIHPNATTATVTIEDNDQTTVSILANLPNAAEPNVNGQFTVRLDNGKTAPPGGITVSYTTSGTATAGSDYTTLPGTVTIPGGASTATISVAVLDDQIVELDETVIVTLTATDHPRVSVSAPGSTATVTIADNDQTTVSIIASDPHAAEPDDHGQFTVRLDNNKLAPPGGIVVTYTTGGTATPGSDYVALPGSVTILAGQSSAVIPVNVIADSTPDEPAETVVVALTAANHPGVSLSTANRSATVTIAEDDPRSATISGIVWVDANDDGQHQRDSNGNPLEPGIPGVIVRLSGTARNGTQFELQAMTDNHGAYRFVDLPAGTYEIRQDQPSAWIDGRESLASSTANDTYANIVLQPSQQAENHSFGERGLQPQFISKRHFLASTPPNDVYFRELNALAMQLAGDAAMAQAIRTASIPSVVSANAAAGSNPAALNAALQPEAESSLLRSAVSPAEGESRPIRPAMSDAGGNPAPSAVSPAAESSRALSAGTPAKGESRSNQAAASAPTIAPVPGGEGEALAFVAVPSRLLWSKPSNSESPPSPTPSGMKPRGGQPRISSVARPDRAPKYAAFPDSDLVGHRETGQAVNRQAHDASSTPETSRQAVDGHLAAIAGEGSEHGSSRPDRDARYRGIHAHRTDDKLDLARIVDGAFAEDNWLDGLE